MSKVTHTHRGHCQLCTLVHAIDVTTGQVAQHGYTVKFGYFTGTCPGSGYLSLHVERTRADASIKAARERAVRLRALADDYEAGRAHPSPIWNGQHKRVPRPTARNPTRTEQERVMVPWEEADPQHRYSAVRAEAAQLRYVADNAEGYANDLTKWAARIFDGNVPAYRVEDLEPRAWKVGDTVRIGGKAGFDAVIEAIEDRDYRTNGYRRGSNVVKVPHARITRPAIAEKRVSEKAGGYVSREARPAKVMWEPLRNIKRQGSQIGDELKKAGKL